MPRRKRCRNDPNDPGRHFELARGLCWHDVQLERKGGGRVASNEAATVGACQLLLFPAIRRKRRKGHFDCRPPILISEPHFSGTVRPWACVKPMARDPDDPTFSTPWIVPRLLILRPVRHADCSSRREPSRHKYCRELQCSWRAVARDAEVSVANV